MSKTKIAYFEGFEVELPMQAVAECHHSGSCDADVAYWKAKLNLQIDPEKLRKELRDVGAWDETELANHDDNLERIIWLAAGNIVEEAYRDK